MSTSFLFASLFTIRHSVRERFAITGISPGFLFLPRVNFSWQQKTPEAVDATSGATYGSWVLELKTKPARLTVLFVIVCCGYLSKEWVYSWGVSPGRPLREPKAFIAEISPLSSMKWMKMKPARVSIFLDSLLVCKRCRQSEGSLSSQWRWLYFISEPSSNSNPEPSSNSNPEPSSNSNSEPSSNSNSESS